MDQARTTRSRPFRTSEHPVGWALATRRCRTRPLPRRHRGNSHSGVVSLTCRVGTLPPRPHPLRPPSLAPRPPTRRPQRRRATTTRLPRHTPTEQKHMGRLSTRRRAALARRMGRAHSPQRRASWIAHHMRVHDRLATSRLHAAGREHRASRSDTAPGHDYLIVADRRRTLGNRPAPPGPSVKSAWSIHSTSRPGALSIGSSGMGSSQPCPCAKHSCTYSSSRSRSNKILPSSTYSNAAASSAYP
jgi:hypothetical protein